MPARYHQAFLRTGRQIGPAYVVRLETIAALLLTGQPHGRVSALAAHQAAVARTGVHAGALRGQGDPHAGVARTGAHGAAVVSAGRPRAAIKEA